jgi:hypothetical protein
MVKALRIFRSLSAVGEPPILPVRSPVLCDARDRRSIKPATYSTPVARESMLV